METLVEYHNRTSEASRLKAQVEKLTRELDKSKNLCRSYKHKYKKAINEKL